MSQPELCGPPAYRREAPISFDIRQRHSSSEAERALPRSVMCFGIVTSIQPPFTPKSMTLPCASWPARGREVLHACSCEPP